MEWTVPDERQLTREGHDARVIGGTRCRLSASQARPGEADHTGMSSPGQAAHARASIVIPSFDRLDLLAPCLSALRATAPEAEVIVVDNGSTDGTVEYLRAEHEAGSLVAILNEENRLFGPACNQAARAASREYLVFLNNDTLAQPGWLDAMVDCIESDPEIGAVGSRLLYPDGTIQHAGVQFDEGGEPFHAHRFAAGDDPAVLSDRDYPTVTGACLLLPRALFLELGGFDESYVMYYEDTDLCLRVWRAGRRVRYCASSVVVHLESQTRYLNRNAHTAAGFRRMHDTWRDAWPEPLHALPGWPTTLGGSPPLRLAEARAFAVVAFADELIADPGLLTAYGRVFGSGDDVTLAVLADASTGDLAALEAAVEEAGLDEDAGADLIVLPFEDGSDTRLLRAIDAVYGERKVTGRLAGLPRFGPAGLETLASLAGAA